MTIHRDDADLIIGLLSSLEDYHLVDVNTNKKLYQSFIRRCDSSIEKVRQMTMQEIRHTFSETCDRMAVGDISYTYRVLDDIDTKHKILFEQFDAKDKLTKAINDGREELQALTTLRERLSTNISNYSPFNRHHPFDDSRSGILYICVIVDTSDVHRLQKSIFRYGKGRLLASYFSINSRRSLIFVASSSHMKMDYALSKIDAVVSLSNFRKIDLPLDGIDSMVSRMRQVTDNIEELEIVT